MIRVTPKLCASAAALLLCVSGSAVAQDDGPTTTYKFGGYAKFDAMFTDYSDSTPDGNSLMRQFYYAPQIPVGDGSGSEDITADFQARETRINFRADTKTAGGDSITAFIEMDFFIHGDGNEVVSNSYSPRLRHAFIKYNKWTFGQTWSTFQDVGALPEALDFVGPAESTTFIRQAMVRYTTGNLELAVENPEAFVAGVPEGVEERGRSTMPDLIARYTFKFGDKGSYLKLAGLYRSIKIGTVAGGAQPDETGYGISASTKLMFGNGADLRAMVTVGDGVGRYIGLGFVRDGYLDGSNIATAEALAYFVSLRLPFGNGWRTNIMYGNTSIDYDNDALAAGLNDTGSSFHVNIIKNILPKLDVGAEFIYGERETVSGLDGDFTRFQFSAKYAF
ncbi:MAG: DcaP family trimeric outer membrane transporter [Gammaproteobacteria bacterium]|nr:DcaP family trimeric outer membrane transporter [Gammaproteobacteria bacterium]MDH3904260.1 DcaP family trimeric outer membrane transporter [Gammaproteobacteria bacterium]MDH3952692.1 DcaP family trimeric outer membrane transporter [Gammaproteobacteria bacterium]MDH4003272.1 DcaP family trimeric outer membrane transporter [Gammaproteobacteria bacterium]